MCSHTYTSLECDGAFRFCIECDTEEKMKELYEPVARGVESFRREEGQLFRSPPHHPSARPVMLSEIV